MSVVTIAFVFVTLTVIIAVVIAVITVDKIVDFIVDFILVFIGIITVFVWGDTSFFKVGRDLSIGE